MKQVSESILVIPRFCDRCGAYQGINETLRLCASCLDITCKEQEKTSYDNAVLSECGVVSYAAERVYQDARAEFQRLLVNTRRALPIETPRSSVDSADGEDC